MKRPKVRELTPTRRGNIKTRQQRDVGDVRHGTVGWGEGGEHFDVEPEGVPLLKVTLFAGHNTETQGINKDPTRAQGLQILVRFNGRVTDIPEDGTHVIVVRPAGMAETPGSYFLLQAVQPDPKLMPNRKAAEKIIYGPKDSFIRFKEDGTVFFFAAAGDDENAPPVFMKLGKDGWEVRHPHGRARANKLGFEMAHSSGAAISGGAVSGAPPPLDTFSSFVNVRAAMVKIEAAAVALGLDAANPDMLTKATPTLAAFAAIGAAFTALNTGLAQLMVDVTAHATALLTPPTSTVQMGNAFSAIAATTAPVAAAANPATAATSTVAGG
jgi:hypothetical protein